LSVACFFFAAGNVVSVSFKDGHLVHGFGSPASRLHYGQLRAAVENGMMDVQDARHAFHMNVEIIARKQANNKFTNFLTKEQAKRMLDLKVVLLSNARLGIRCDLPLVYMCRCLP
jgi:hypothetical protein